MLISRRPSSAECLVPAVLLGFLVTGIIFCHKWSVRYGIVPHIYGGSGMIPARPPPSTEDVRIPENLLAAKGLPIEAGTFLYLSMGPEQPTPFTYERACFPKSALIFLTFKAPMNADNNTSDCNLTSVFYPRSTWATGRNELLRHAVLLEGRRGRRYEFFIFTDNDIKLITYPRPTSTHQADMLLRQLLLQYRPLRGSIRFNAIPLKPISHTKPECGMATYTDACVDAYHRTGVGILLPYIPVLDKMSWYMSAYIINLLAAALAPGHCHVYRQLGADKTVFTHANYPRGSGSLDAGVDWKVARDLVQWLLVRKRVAGYSSRDDLKAKLQDKLFGKLLPNGTEESCRVQSVGVDYAKLIPY